MKKRGQIAVFVVIGIVILLVLVLLFAFKDKLGEAIRKEPTNVQEYLNLQLEDIKKEYSRCVGSETRNAIKLLIKNAGEFNISTNYIRYAGENYPVLCSQFKDQNLRNGCLARPIFTFEAEEKLNDYLNDEVKSCLNLNSFRNKDYDLNLSEQNLSVKIFEDHILVNVNRDIKLKKGSFLAETNTFIYNVETPLGELIKVVNDLVQIVASGNDIDPLAYGLSSRNKYLVVVKKPYPDEIYQVSKVGDSDNIFYFAILKEGRYPRVEGRLR